MRPKLSPTLTFIAALAALAVLSVLAWALLVPSLLRARVGSHGGIAANEPAPAPGTPAERLAALVASRKLIRSGQLTVEVAECQRASLAVQRVAGSHGGYVAESQAVSTIADKRRATITIRVAAEHFDAAVSSLKALGNVRSETISTQDVTKSYVALETRLRVKRETEARLREVLRARSARVADLVEAERELGRVIEAIEEAEGERRFYERQVALSTIAVTLEEPQAAILEAALTPLAEALREALPLLARSAAVVIYVLVFLAPWLALVALVLGGVRARRALRKPKATLTAV